MFRFKSCRNVLAARAEWLDVLSTHCVAGRAVSVGPAESGRRVGALMRTLSTASFELQKTASLVSSTAGTANQPLHPVIAAPWDWNQLICVLCGPLCSFVFNDYFNTSKAVPIAAKRAETTAVRLTGGWRF
jgi:hypothetical protein